MIRAIRRMSGRWYRRTICSTAACEPASACATSRASATVSMSIVMGASSTEAYARPRAGVATVARREFALQTCYSPLHFVGAGRVILRDGGQRACSRKVSAGGTYLALDCATMGPNACSCATELGGAATGCEHCGELAGDAGAGTPARADGRGHDGSPSLGDGDATKNPTTPGVATTTVEPGSARVSRRQMATILLAAVSGAMLIFALLPARGAAAREHALVRVETPAPERASSAALQPTSGPSPKWSSANASRWVGGARKSVALELPAINKVQVWMRHVRPVLVIRCSSGSTEAFVFTDSAARMEPQDEDHTVRVRFDEGADLTERWPDSLDHDALFAPDGAAFAEQLTRARTLQFGFTPHNADPVVAHFDVTGLSDLIAPGSKQCGRKK